MVILLILTPLVIPIWTLIDGSYTLDVWKLPFKMKWVRQVFPTWTSVVFSVQIPVWYANHIRVDLHLHLRALLPVQLPPVLLHSRAAVPRPLQLQHSDVSDCETLLRTSAACGRPNEAEEEAHWSSEFSPRDAQVRILIRGVSSSEATHPFQTGRFLCPTLQPNCFHEIWWCSLWSHSHDFRPANRKLQKLFNDKLIPLQPPSDDSWATTQRHLILLECSRRDGPDAFHPVLLRESGDRRGSQCWLRCLRHRLVLLPGEAAIIHSARHPTHRSASNLLWTSRRGLLFRKLRKGRQFENFTSKSKFLSKDFHFASADEGNGICSGCFAVNQLISQLNCCFAHYCQSSVWMSLSFLLLLSSLWIQ